MARKKDHRCGVDTPGKCQDSCYDLAHYHLAHAPEVCRKSYTWFEAQLDGFPDIFVISDPETRAAFRQFAADLVIKKSKAVKELERLFGLPADSTKGQKKLPDTRNVEPATETGSTQKKKD